jgi:hypothetical protein
MWRGPTALSHLIRRLWGKTEREFLSLSQMLFFGWGGFGGSMTSLMAHPVTPHTLIYFRASGGPVKHRPNFIHFFYGNSPYSRH